MTYQQWFEIASVGIRHKEHYTYFRDGAARRAALAAVRAQEAGCGRESIISAVVDSLDRDSHVCYFDDPCDDFRVTA